MLNLHKGYNLLIGRRSILRMTTLIVNCRELNNQGDESVITNMKSCNYGLLLYIELAEIDRSIHGRIADCIRRFSI